MTDLMHTLLTLTLTGSGLAVGLALLRRLTGDRLPKALHYYLWLLVLLRLALPWSLPGAGVELPQPQAPQLIEVAPPLNIDPEYIQIIQGDPIPMPEGMEKYVVSTPTRPWYTTLWSWVCDHFLWLWLGGAALHFLWFVGSYLVYSRRLWGNCQPLEEHEQAFLTDLNGGRAIRACRSPLARTPMVLGLLRPAILLPQRDITTRQLEYILRHELTHVRRRDLWFKWAAVAVTSLHWFNPLMPWVRREIARCCELSCDEAVIGTMSPERQREYGETLLALAADQTLPRAVPATTLCEEKKRLKERLQGILKYKQATAAVILLCCMVAVVIGGLAAIFGPRTVNEDIPLSLYSAPDWVSLSDGLRQSGLLTGGEMERAVDLVKDWQRKNLPEMVQPKLSLTTCQLSDLNLLAGSSNGVYCLDVKNQSITPFTGPVEGLADCGAALLFDDSQTVRGSHLFLLTGSGRMASAADGLRQAMAELQYLSDTLPGATLSKFEWTVKNGAVESMLVSCRGESLRKWEYSGALGRMEEDKTVNENLHRWGTLDMKYLYGMVEAIAAWQQEHDPVNGDTYLLSYLTPTIAESFLSDVSEYLGVARYDPRTGAMTVVERPTKQDAANGIISLLYPAKGSTWLYVIAGEAPAQVRENPYDRNGDGVMQTGEYPVPTGEAMGLSGEAADLYTAVAREMTARRLANVGADDTMLMLPTLRVHGQYAGEKGQTHYVCGYGEQHFYDLGLGLFTPSGPKYASMGGLGYLVRFTLDKEGNLVGVMQTEDGADNTGRIRQICGSLTALADDLIAGKDPETPDMPKGNDLLAIYLKAYFE